MEHVGRKELFLNSNLAPPLEGSQYNRFVCACVCPRKTLDVAVKNTHLDPCTDRIICKLMALSLQGSERVKKKKKLSEEGAMWIKDRTQKYK